MYPARNAHARYYIVICGLSEKKKFLSIKRVSRFSLQLFSETAVIVSKTERDMIVYPLFLSDFDETWIFSTHFRKILKYQIS